MLKTPSPLASYRVVSNWAHGLLPSSGVARPALGLGSSPRLRRTLWRRSFIAPASFHLIPESRTAMATSGRPVVTCQAVWTFGGSQLPARGLVTGSATEAPRTPQSSAFRLRTSAFCAWKAGLELSGSGVAANFQALPSPPRSLGTGLPDGLHGKSAWAMPPPAAIIASAQPDTVRPLRNAPPGTLGGSLRVNARVRQWEPSRFGG